eukprot:COSAG02_NODE_2682_length_8253_cov_3.591857_2_plen_76_part_00
MPLFGRSPAPAPAPVRDPSFFSFVAATSDASVGLTAALRVCSGIDGGAAGLGERADAQRTPKTDGGARSGGAKGA